MDNVTTYILRELEDPKVTIGALILSLPDDSNLDYADIGDALLKARAKVETEGDWTYEDVVGALPKEWKASLHHFQNIYV